MKYFLDTEFYEKPGSIDLISIGIVSENGDEFYAENTSCNKEEIEHDGWLIENVIPNLKYWDKKDDKAGECFIEKKVDSGIYEFSMFGNIGEIKGSLLSWLAKLGEIHPEFYGYYCDYDWVVFCWIFGRMIDLPQFFPMYCRDLKQTLDELNIRKTLDGDNHNALDDAKATKELYYYIEELVKEDVECVFKFGE